MIVCLNCGKEFKSTSLKKYCSITCGNRYRNKRHYNKSPDKIMSNRVLQNSKVESRILSRVKSRAKRLGIDFNITVEDIKIPEKCPVLGLTLILSNQGSGYHKDSPSLDRINPKGGYVKGNVRIISARANLLKNDATSKELRAVLEDLERIERDSF